MVVWVGPSYGAPHDARIKVMQVHGTRMDSGSLADVALRPRPHVAAGHLTAADLQAVSQWIALNETAILDHWNGLTDGAEFGRHTSGKIIDIALKVKAQTYSFEAANVRHQHEMEVWKKTKFAPGTILMPGVISHATNIVEHPELIARRLVDCAGIVGRDNVVGGADCGMGGRVHAEIGWTKLAALVEGAALATNTLWH
jgi:methionine synthase II (cobalamin-independent)